MMIRSESTANRHEKGTVNATLFFALMIGMAVALIVVKFSIISYLFVKAIDLRLWLGVETVELTPDIKKQFDIQSSNGLLVSRTFVNSPAQMAGVLEGDVIRRWNGISITSQEQLQQLVQSSGNNEQVKLTIDRQGKPLLAYFFVGIRPGGL